MRRLTCAFFAIVAACSQAEVSISRNDSPIANIVVAQPAMVAAATPEVDADSRISVGPDGSVEMAASTLHTQCAVADQYPDQRVQPAFYSNPPPPEFERYIQCVRDEADHDNGGPRLASASSFPPIGICYLTRIVAITGRMGERPSRDAGTAVAFANRLGLVDYGYVPAVARSRVGDKVRTCVHDLPEDCPADDLRGIGYRTRNLRTGESWIMGDSQHVCRASSHVVRHEDIFRAARCSLMLEHIPHWLGSALSEFRAGADKLAIVQPLLGSFETLHLASPAFANGARLPERFTADGAGVSPPLFWTGVPEGTTRLALIVEDPDAPTPQPLVHAVVWDLPPDGDLKEGAIRADGAHSDDGSDVGRNSFFGEGWLAPDPPTGHGEHNYAFQLFALAEGPDAGENPGRGALLAAMEGRVLAAGLLTGTYSRGEESPIGPVGAGAFA